VALSVDLGGRRIIKKAKIPIVLAAWTPAGVTLMLGIATLLHLEDG
jgi:lipopolysaccharide export system permease protein